ncbi:hypothetical protein DRJ54_07630 [Candidatus Acetothermia bacterium]|nr:MAG: hypothetical protein DRJ54_07630 [Candidatus Acetothermia bacterium]
MAQRDQEFYQLAEAFIDRMLAEAPTAATYLGDHRYDDRLGHHTQEDIRRQSDLTAGALAAFQAFPPDELSPEARIDRELMVGIAKSFLRDFQVLRGHVRDPGYYPSECLGGIFSLIIRDFAPLPERVKSALGRLREVPRVLEEGKANLVPEEVPEVWCEVAIESASQGVALFTMLIPALAKHAPAIEGDLVSASKEAATAMEGYVSFLKGEVLPSARGDFAVGEELFEELLRETHMLDYTADELYELGWELFRGTKEEMERLAAEISPGKTAREILDEAKADHPGAEELLDAYRREMERAKSFVIEKGIATVPEGERLRIEPTPPFLAPVIPYAAYMPPGPLEEVQEGIFLVTPVPPDAPEELSEEKLRGHNWAKLPVTALHEAYPGHHLQLCYANQVGRLPRKLGGYLSSLFPEGWAFYCEELMEELGFIGEPIQRLGRLNDQLWRAARIILDVSLHTRGLTVEEAVDFLVEEVGLERANALAEVRRYTSSPTQPLSYLVGKLEILKLIEEFKAKAPGGSLRELHDAILSCGSLPPRLMRTCLGL